MVCMVIRTRFTTEEGFKIQQLAHGAQTSPEAIVEGIVRLYLRGGVKEATSARERELIDAVVTAVRKYSAGGDHRAVSESVKSEIKRLRGEGKTLREVAAMLKVGPATVHRYS